MGTRTIVTAAGLAFSLGTALLACVDLFHGTDFDTLCTVSPGDPACVADGDAPADAGATDATEAPPHPDFCAWSASEARTQALRACAWLGACEGPLGESAFGPCVVRAQLAFNCAATPTLRPAGAVDAFWACLATVASCGDVDRCVFPGGVQQCVAVSGTSTACGSVGANSAVRVECAGGAGRAAGVEPCVMLGKTCATENASTATCSGTSGFDCATSGCSGTRAVDCNLAGQRTLDRGVDCAGYGGGACVAEEAGAACVPASTASACSKTSPPTCQGSIVTSCAGGKLSRVSCSSIGLPCDVSEPVPLHDLSAACIDRGPSACNVADSCSGGSLLESCGRGATFTVDCAKLGLGKCTIGGNGRASCTAPPN